MDWTILLIMVCFLTVSAGPRLDLAPDDQTANPAASKVRANGVPTSRACSQWLT
jgi:hypothetical protein